MIRRITIIIVIVVVLISAYAIVRTNRQESTPSPLPVATAPVVETPDPIATPVVEIPDSPPSSPPVSIGENEIAGRVVDNNGNAIADANVAAYEPDHKALKTTTDAKGAFRFSELNVEKSYRVSATKDGLAEAVQDVVLPGTNNLVLTLGPLTALEGVVVSNDTGDPIEAFEIAYIHGPSVTDRDRNVDMFERNLAWKKFSDPDGRFRVDEIMPGHTIGVAARAPGFAPAMVNAGPFSVDVTGEVVRVPLLPEARVEGEVLSQSGSRIGNVRVYFTYREDSSYERSILSGADGRFALSDLAEGVVFLKATHPEYAAATQTVVVSARTTTRVSLTLPVASTIEGQVWRGDTPVEGATIALELITARNLTDRPETRTYTDANGVYSVGALAPGRYTVVAEIKGDEETRSLSREVDVLAGQSVAVDFRLEEETGMLFGQVTYRGEPAPGAAISAIVGGELGNSAFSAQTDESGNYRVESVQPGALRGNVSISAINPQSGLSTRLQREFSTTVLANAETQFDIEFNAEGVVEGTVSGVSENEIAAAYLVAGKVEVDPDKTEELMAIERTAYQNEDVVDGAFVFRDVDPGDYTVVLFVFNPDDSAGDPLDSLRSSFKQIHVEGASPVSVAFSF